MWGGEGEGEGGYEQRHIRPGRGAGLRRTRTNFTSASSEASRIVFVSF